MAPRRISSSQLRSQMRQAQAKAERQVRSEVQKQARKIENGLKREATKAVNDHNRQVRANRRRLESEVARLNRGQQHRTSVRYTVTRTSALRVHSIYREVEHSASVQDWDERRLALLDLAETETANSAHVANALLGDSSDDLPEREGTALTDELSSVSDDLDKRWRGALFSISTDNPDAARHFCTSAREILIEMINLKAPDSAVVTAYPDGRTPDGRVARRSKIRYLLDLYGADDPSLGEFVDADIDDVMNLFGAFNKGTHGDAGRYAVTELRVIKTRVEGAVRFLSTVIRGI